MVVNDLAATLGIELIGEHAAASNMDIDHGGKQRMSAKAKGFDDIRRKVKQIVREGYSASQLLSQVMEKSKSKPPPPFNALRRN